MIPWLQNERISPRVLYSMVLNIGYTRKATTELLKNRDAQASIGTIKIESTEMNLGHLLFFLSSPSDFNMQPELNASSLKGVMIKKSSWEGGKE